MKNSLPKDDSEEKLLGLLHSLIMENNLAEIQLLSHENGILFNNIVFKVSCFSVYSLISLNFCVFSI